MNRVTDIVFLIEYPFERWDFDRFGIETLKRAGFTIQVWDISPIVHARAMRIITASDPVRYDAHRRFLAAPDVVAAIRGLRPACIAVCLITYTLESLPVFRALSGSGIPFVVASNNAFPRRTGQTARRVLNILRRFQPRRLAEAALMRLPCECLGVHQAALLLAGGARSCDVIKPTARASRVVWLHAWDYDAYLRACSAAPGAGERVGVFLDEFSPYHPDYALEGTLPPITADEYYPLLCHFFDDLERRCGIRIVVAAHPRSHYERLPDHYGGRRVIRGRTAELVRDAHCVLAHSSTSINFAVLFRKPIIFLTSRTLRSSRWEDSIALMASVLGKAPVDLEAPAAVDMAHQLVVDGGAYAAYQHDYIKKAGTPDLPFWQQFAEYVHDLPAESHGMTETVVEERAGG